MRTRVFRRGDVIRIRDERWIVSRQLSHDDTCLLDVRGCDKANRGIHTSFLLPFDVADAVPPARAPRVVRTMRVRRAARGVLADATASILSLRTLAAAGIDILPFQLEPAMAFVEGRAARLLIADEVGLGKTVQAGLLLAEALGRQPAARALVVTPASLREQWTAELRTRFGLQPVTLDAIALTRPAAHIRAGANPWAVHRLVVTSMDFVKRPEVLRALEPLIWDVLVFDEAHALAGPSDRHTAAAALGARARSLVMLTATPHGGDDEAFARLRELGNIERQFPLLVFRRTRRDVGMASARRSAWLSVRPSSIELETHQALLGYARQVWRHEGRSAAAARLAMIVLTQRACSSAHSLARSIERRLALLAAGSGGAAQLALPLGIGDDDELLVLGGPGLPDADEERGALERILGLAREAASDESKVNAVRRLLRRTGEAAIVFTHYRDTLDHVAAALHGRPVAQLHGALTAAERRDVLRQFSAGAADLLLATDAASEGLNLQQRCRLVIHLEVPWSPSRLEQRVGRVDRIGQTRRVHQVVLVARGTSEETHVAPLVRRRTVKVLRALDALRASPIENEIAGSILAGHLTGDHAAIAEGSAAAEGYIVADVKAAAHAEAACASNVRRLCQGGIAPGDGRPLAASVATSVAAGITVFRVGITTELDELLWEAVLGVTCTFQRTRVGRPEQVRRWTARTASRVQAALAQHYPQLLAQVGRLSAPAGRLAILRERHLMAAATERHARLASLLVQPGLFDRRTDRAAASQRAVLEEILLSCRHHLSRVTARERLGVGNVEHLFTLLHR